MDFDDGFHNLQKSYPDPFASQQPYNPRAVDNQHYAPDKPRFKVLDGSSPDQGERSFPSTQTRNTAGNDNYTDMRRDQNPSYHTLPNPDTAHYVQPYQHTMKRPSNADRMKEIFGEHQDYSRLNEPDFKRSNREEYGVNPMVMPPRNDPRQMQVEQPRQNPVGNLPRMKYIEADDPRPGGGERNQQPTKDISNDYRKIYNAILEVFPRFIMTKTAAFGQFSVYKAVVQCLLCDGTRYVVAIVKDDTSPIRTKKPLTMLAWVNFQTRYLDDDREHKEFQLSSHPYVKPDRTILDDVIRLSRKTTTANLYNCDNLPLDVEVIRTRDDEDIAEVGSVFGALELFSTLLSFSDN
jgi:hypothetical protein